MTLIFLWNWACRRHSWDDLTPLGQGRPGEPINARQVNFGVFNGGGQQDNERTRAAERLDFTGFALELRVIALELNRDDPALAVDWLFQHGQNYEANMEQDRAQAKASVDGLAAEMALLGFDVDECKKALQHHNNNMESAVNWLIESAGNLEIAGSGPRLRRNSDAVLLEQVRAPRVSADTIASNSRADALALELSRQELVEDPSLLRDGDGMQCFRCGGTGVRQGLLHPRVSSTEIDIGEAVAGKVVVPQVPYCMPPAAPSASTSESKLDSNLDQIPVAVVLRVGSDSSDGGALRRAASLERYLSGSTEEEDDESAGGEGKSAVNASVIACEKDDKDRHHASPSDSISLKSFSAEELGLLGGSESKAQESAPQDGPAIRGHIRRTRSRRKIKKVSRTQAHHLDLAKDACWVCDGTGTLSKYFRSLDVAECTDKGEEPPECGICWCDPAEYGLSTTCAHVYCRRCLKGHLESAMSQGKFPAYCPACAAAVDDGSEPPCGKIDGATLSFLAQRGVITHEFQFRFMRQQKEIERQFFGCPANCGRILLEPVELKWLGDRNAPYMAPGECVCGAMCCVVCHQRLLAENVRTHDCPASKLGADMTDNELLLLHNRGVRKCPRCSTFIQKNEGCHIMMCGNNAHGSIEEARSRGGCGYEGHWKTYLPLVERKVLNVEEKMRTYSSAEGGHNKSRLDASPGWRAAKDKSGEWMMMDLGAQHVIAGVQLQGRDCSTPNKGDWWRFKEFSVSVSLDGKSFDLVKGSKTTFFKGPPDSWTKTDRLFPVGPVAARFVKLTVHSWHHHIAGRAAVILADDRVQEVASELEGEAKSADGETKEGGDAVRGRRRRVPPARGAIEYALRRREAMQNARKNRTRK